MRATPWSRAAAIERVRHDVWRYLTHYAERERDVALVAAALLQIPLDDVRRFADVQFVLSDEVGRLLEAMPALARRLRTVTTNELEVSEGRLRGSVRWGETYSRRAATGTANLFVTAPARRAFGTPENELLAFALDAVARIGRATGWHKPALRGQAQEVVRRVGEAERWLQLSALAGVAREPPADKQLARVRAGRRVRDYQPVLAVVDLHRRLVGQLDRRAVQEAVERHALVTLRDSVLLELCCAFDTVGTLADLGWEPEPAGIVGSGRIYRCTREEATLDVYYQHLPERLASGSRYREIQRAHSFARVYPLRPDLVLHRRGPDGERWVLVEAKQRGDASVGSAARDALLDLLGYRRDLETALAGCGEPYGLGYVWGAELRPEAGSEVVLCTPDTLGEALAICFAA